jgi:Family of unknown function (DUF6519)
MKGDFTRVTFDPSHQFTRVLSQQGRVQLDADTNEQTAILLHYLQALAADLIGPHGGPADITRINQQKQEELVQVNCGFEIIATEDRIKQLPEAEARKNELVDLLKKSKPPLLLGKGRYYVDGILSENPEYIAFSDQPGYPFLDNGGDLQGNYLVYLDVWERHLTYLEMEDADGSVISIRESALNGPDTATRAQLVWQIKMTNKVGDSDIPDRLPQNSNWRDWVDEHWLDDWRSQWQQWNRGTLKARAFQPTSSPDDACITPPTSRYRGAENQLYRVEIHHGGQARSDKNEGAENIATFKWSRENGSVIFPIQNISNKIVTLYSMGRDQRFGLQPDDWVEVVDDDYTLQNRVGPLLQVDMINYDDSTVTLKGSPEGGVGEDLTKHPLLRRWDQRAAENITVTADGVRELTESTSDWIDLEDGVQIQFQPGGTYYTGDYWLIPARTATGDVEWQGPKDAPKALSPHGIEHHYAPLWIISAGSTITADPTNDLRRQFKQLWLLKSE